MRGDFVDDQRVMCIVENAGSGDVNNAISGNQQTSLAAPFGHAFEQFLRIVKRVYLVRQYAPKQAHASKCAWRIANP